MKNWYNSLSATQRRWLFSLTAFLIVVITLSVLIVPEKKPFSPADYTTDMSLRQLAPKLGVTGKALARELGLPISSPKKKPLKKLNVSADSLRHAAEHLLSHRDSKGKYFIFAALILSGMLFLICLWHPDNRKQDKKTPFPRILYAATLLLSVVFCGFILGKSPNPMEGAVKVFKSMVGLYPDPAAKVVAFVFFISLAILGNKIICGWACPLGSLQELIFSLPVLKKIKKHKLPFWLTNSIRGLLFVVTLLFLFAVIGGKKGFVLYHYINVFNLFNFDFDSTSLIIAAIATGTISFVTYRPFCSLICPFGFLSWLAEKISVFRIKINYNACTKCGACARICPNEAAKGRVENRKLPADCFSCGRCLDSCPEDAIHFTAKRTKDLQ